MNEHPACVTREKGGGVGWGMGGGMIRWMMGERIASGGILLRGWRTGEKADVGAVRAAGAVADEGKDYE